MVKQLSTVRSIQSNLSTYTENRKEKKVKRGRKSLVQLLSRVWLFGTQWTTACQALLSITNTWSLLKFMSIESVMPSNHLVLCHPLLPCLHSFQSFPVNQFFPSDGQSTEVSALPSVLPMNTQD